MSSLNPVGKITLSVDLHGRLKSFIVSEAYKCHFFYGSLLLKSVKIDFVLVSVTTDLNVEESHTLTTSLERIVNFFKGLWVYFTVTTGANAKNILILLASSGFVENAMKAEREEHSSL